MSGLPFYSTRDLAVISLADYGNEEIAWLEFGNLTFTPRALREALATLRGDKFQVGIGTIDKFDRTLLGPTGIPDDDAADGEWLRQTEKLASRLPERSIAEIDAAVRLLIRLIPISPDC